MKGYALKEIKKQYVEKVLMVRGDDLYEAAKTLGVSPTTVRKIADRPIIKNPFSTDEPMKTLAEVEKEHILDIFKSMDYKADDTADVIEVSRHTLARKLDSYGLSADKACMSWGINRYIKEASKYESLDEWFLFHPGAVRTAHMLNRFRKVRKDVWGQNTIRY